MNGLDIEGIFKSAMGALKTEDIVVEAVRDLVKDEIKEHIKKKLKENPELKEQARSAAMELMESKVKETYAMVKLGRVAAELGITMVPPELKAKMEEELTAILEREVTKVFEKI